MNTTRMMYKLQSALCRRGRVIRINVWQFYSEEAKRMISKYSLVEDGETIMESCSTAEVVRFLAGELGES